jgi:hypothetical protein
MAKGQVRSNKEVRKPKAAKAAPKPVAVSAGTAVKNLAKDTLQKKPAK